MVFQVLLFSFVFWENWRHRKEISKLTDLQQCPEKMWRTPLKGEKSNSKLKISSKITKSIIWLSSHIFFWMLSVSFRSCSFSKQLLSNHHFPPNEHKVHITKIELFLNHHFPPNKHKAEQKNHHLVTKPYFFWMLSVSFRSCSLSKLLLSNHHFSPNEHKVHITKSELFSNHHFPPNKHKALQNQISTKWTDAEVIQKMSHCLEKNSMSN